MHSKARHLPDSGPFLALGYVVLWLLLWSTVQPYWMLPYGLRFGALLLAPMRYWGWLLGVEFVAGIDVGLFRGLPSDWYGVAIDTLPEPLVMAAGVWLLRRCNPHASLHTPQDVTRLLLAAVMIVVATTMVVGVLSALMHAPDSTQQLVGVVGEALLGHYLGILLIAPLMILLVRSRPDRSALTGLMTDGVLVLLPSMAVLLLLSEQAAPQPQLARVLSLAPVLYFAFRHGWRGASLAMLITSLGMTLLDQRLGHGPSGATAYLFLAVAGTGALLLGSATDALRRSNEKVVEQNAYLGAVNRRLDHLAHQMRSGRTGTKHHRDPDPRQTGAIPFAQRRDGGCQYVDQHHPRPYAAGAAPPVGRFAAGSAR